MSTMKRRKSLVSLGLSSGNQLPSFSELILSFSPSANRSNSTGSQTSLTSFVTSLLEATTTSDEVTSTKNRLLDEISDYGGIDFLYNFPPSDKKDTDFGELFQQFECLDNSWNQIQEFHTQCDRSDINTILSRATTSNGILEPISKAFSIDDLKATISLLKSFTSVAERLVNHKLQNSPIKQSPKRVKTTMKKKYDLIHGVEEILNLEIKNSSLENIGHDLEMSFGGLNHEFSVSNPNMECQHCLSSMTPEWRRGPNGSRTLCNACGIYYSKLVKKYGRNKAYTEMKDKQESGDVLDRKL